MNIHFEKLELHKILAAASAYASLAEGKAFLVASNPETELSKVQTLLSLTEEATKLLFFYGVGRIEAFDPFDDELQRAAKRATLSCAELLKVDRLLRSVRILVSGIESVNDDTIVLVREKIASLVFDPRLEEDIHSKIVSDTEVSDFASEKLYSIRREIRLLNEKIRSKLSEYLTGENAKYLQEGIVTMRGDRYVLPVKAEYKRSVKGFVHDRSQSGATVFIEPEYILDLNNELITLAMDEKEEIDRILGELSRRVGILAESLVGDISLMAELDAPFAKTEYCYHLRSVKPMMNDKGVICIRNGRHPLIDKDKVVPVSVELGKDYDFLLVSGPNTGGKTVTLKMVGLFCLMAACGFFVPMGEGSSLSVFRSVFCDIGDAQSIEESLSTFSSHITNLVSIVDCVDENSLVLIDELGGGTDPEEGQALARAVISYLMKSGCKGIVTTHYMALKEFAFREKGIENASMTFDANSLKPLYRIKIGLPGSSNALSISRRLGLKEEILQNAFENLSDDAKSLTNLLKSAEESRLKAQTSLERTALLEREWQEKINLLDAERESLRKEKEKLFLTAKAEAKRIVREKAEEAEELVLQIEEIFEKEELSEADLIQARTLKNRVLSASYRQEEEKPLPKYLPFAGGKIGENVYVKSVAQEGVLLSLNDKKREAEVMVGDLKLRVKLSELMSVTKTSAPMAGNKQKQRQKSSVTVVRKGEIKAPVLSVNVIGMTVMEAIPEVDAFIDQAILSNLEEIKIIHGMGTGKLKAGIHDFLRKHKAVAEFRLGVYGEGETGVTFVKLK